MQSSSLRILFVSCEFPYPKVDHTGGKDFFNRIKFLSEKHEVSLISLIRPFEEKYTLSMEPFCADMELISRSKLGGLVRYSPLRLVYPKRYFSTYSHKFRRELCSWLASKRFDIVHLWGPWMGQYLDSVKDARIVLDELDVHSLVAYREYQNAKYPLKKTYNLLEWVQSHIFELKMCQKADLVLTRSNKDERFLRHYLPHLNVKTISTWFEGLEQFSAVSEKPSEPRSLLFFGSMRRSNNADAAIYFYETIFPLIRRKVPEVKFYIVGSSPTREIQQLAKDRNVIVTGYVEDISRYYERCAILVAPILVGGGIITKILNAMAAGRPVVTNSFGNEGIEAIPEQEIRIADSLEEFAQKTVELLTCDSLWHRIARNGREFVRRKYDWGKAMQELEHAYFNLLT